MASDEQVIKDKEKVLQTSTPFIRTSAQSAQGGQLDGSLFEIPTKKQDSTVNLDIDTSLLDQTSRHEETASEHSTTNVTQLNAGFINSTSVCSESESISIQQPNETDRGHLDAIIEEEEDNEQPPGIAASDTGDAAVKTETQSAETETQTAETETQTAETETHTAETETHTAEIGTAETNINASDTDSHTAAEAETSTATHARTDPVDTENTETAKTDTHSGTIKSSTKVAKESNSRYIESKGQQPEKQRKRKRLTKAEQATLEALESFGGSDLGSVLLKNETFEERLAKDKEALESEKMEGVPLPARKKTRLELAQEEAKLAFENIPLGQTEKKTTLPVPPTIYKDTGERKLTQTQRAKLEVLQSFGGSGFDELFPKKKEEEEEEEKEEGEGITKEGIYEEDKKENKPVSETGLTS